jgi:hypothetical protein
MKVIYDALEKKRMQLQLTEEALCEGICSVRTYRRYIYEETDMPFKMLERFSEKLNQSVYDMLYFVEHRIKLDHFDEVLLLDTLIQDDYDKAHTLYQAFKSHGKEMTVHPFLLPLMLEKMEAVLSNLPLDGIHRRMIEALRLDVLVKRPFISVEHIKLIEHVLPFTHSNDQILLEIILKRVMNRDMTLIRASRYTFIKCHQLYFQLILTSDDHALKVQTFLDILKKVYDIGGELALDEIFLQAKLHDLHRDHRLEHIFKRFHIPSSFMYHAQNPLSDEDDMMYLKEIGLDEMFNFHGLKEVLDEIS